MDSLSIIRRPAPTFIWPAFSAVRWAIAFCVGMVAVPAPHHTLAWLCLLPFCAHTYRALRATDRYLYGRARYQLQKKRKR